MSSLLPSSAVRRDTFYKWVAHTLELLQLLGRVQSRWTHFTAPMQMAAADSTCTLDTTIYPAPARNLVLPHSQEVQRSYFTDFISTYTTRSLLICSLAQSLHFNMTITYVDE